MLSLEVQWWPNFIRMTTEQKKKSNNHQNNSIITALKHAHTQAAKIEEDKIKDTDGHVSQKGE